MNYLAHVFLADSSRESRLGNLLGDFMQGVELATLPPAIGAGVAMHRQVDAFTDSHGVVRRSRARFAPPLRRFAGILCDVLFDHFLTRHWTRYAGDLGLRQLTGDVYGAIDDHWEIVPERLRRVALPMRRDDWLASYGALDNVERALAGISRRMRHRNPIGAAGPDIRTHYLDLEADFLEFFPTLIEFRPRVSRICAP